MTKLGLPRYRYSVAILCWLYIILSVLMLFICYIDVSFRVSVFGASLLFLLIGYFGLYSLHKENATLMRICGIIFVCVTVLQVFQILGLLLLTVFRESLLNFYIKKLMDTYEDENNGVLDNIQWMYECCGRQSYKDWTVQPYSCCKTFDCSLYHVDGCVAAISVVIPYVALKYGLISIIAIAIHIFPIVSAFKLAKMYKSARIYGQQPIQPNVVFSKI